MTFKSHAISVAAAVIRSISKRQRLPRPVNLGNAVSILVIKLDALGDFVLATAFLRELRLAAPQSRITIITSNISAPLAQACPHADQAVTFQINDKARRGGTFRQLWEIDRFFRFRLDNHPFDLVFIPRSGPDLHGARLVAYLSGASRRIGFSSQTIAYPSLDLTEPIAYPELPIHEVEAHLLLLRSAGATPQSNAIELFCPENEAAEVEKLLVNSKIGDSSTLIVMGVGASLPHKKWPANKFLELARHLLTIPGYEVVLIGDQHDKTRFPDDQDRIHNWAGRLTPNQSWFLLQHARLFVGNDSGALHLASAARCPMVIISWDNALNPDMGVNSPVRFAPFAVPNRVIRSMDSDRRSEASAVHVAQVVSACEELLGIPSQTTAGLL